MVRAMNNVTEIIFDKNMIVDHPCGWGRAGFGVGSVKGSALVPDSAMNVSGWFGQDADESLQKCELTLCLLRLYFTVDVCRACGRKREDDADCTRAVCTKQSSGIACKR